MVSRFFSLSSFEAETVEFAVEVDEKKAIGELLAAFWEK
jgi:purine nucleosidase